MKTSSIEVATDLIKKLPPPSIEAHLLNVIELVPDLTEELLATVDQPLRVLVCPKTFREYLCCDYNRDGDSYRSPWSNEYDPPLSDGALPSDKLRSLENVANEAFEVYRELYFEGGLSSVYLWDLDNGFAAAILLKKVSDENKRMKGAWDSIHVVQVEPSDSKGNYKYRLTSSVLLYLITGSASMGTMNLSGNITRQAELNATIDDERDHIATIGKIVEEMENKIRSSLQEVYFGKTKDVVNELRSLTELSTSKKQSEMQRIIMNTMQEQQRKK